MMGLGLCGEDRKLLRSRRGVSDTMKTLVYILLAVLVFGLLYLTIRKIQHSIVG